MKLLYLSCHSILEYDEVKLFHELGHDVFSAGAYSNPAGHPSLPRPAIDMPYYPELERAASTIHVSGGSIPQELIDWADVVMFMHQPEIIEKNWPKLQGKRVIFRSIGQMVPHQEQILQPLVNDGLEIVRYSPREATIQHSAGTNAVIRFYKDPEEYKGWTGKTERIINFSQSLKQRASFCGYDSLMTMSDGLPRVFYGPDNGDLGNEWGGLLTNEEQLAAMRDNRAMFYHGTYPASYTLSLIEAMMTGMPVVAVGAALGNGPMFRQQRTYEVDWIIENGINGFISDELPKLNQYLVDLLKDHYLARRIGDAGRNRAIELFGKETIREQWRNFLLR